MDDKSYIDQAENYVSIYVVFSNSHLTKIELDIKFIFFNKT